MRVHVQLRNEKMNAKIREHALEKVPFQRVVGDVEAFVERVKGLIETKTATL
jgi:threonyl-tRNA synthetase